MSSLLIKNGNIITASDEFTADILITDDKISKIGANLSDPADKVIDASGKYVFPGGVDQHTHFNFKFGDAVVKGWETSCAAVLGGTTTVIDFCNQEIGKSLKESVDNYRANKIDGITACDYALHTVLYEDADEIIDEIQKLPDYGISTCKLFMAYKGHPQHCDDSAVLKALESSKKAGVTIMLHCENADMIDTLQKQCIKEGLTSPYAHAISRPPIVETECTERAISLAKLADAPVYIVHISESGALNAVREAYADGVKVFGETCTHYLTITKDKLALENFEGAKYVCSPALREQCHLDALWDGVKKGYITAISSDHCGFDWIHDKHQGKDDFRDIPNGTPGMENRINVIWSKGVSTGKISRQKFVEMCCTNPAKINGIYPQKGTIAIGSDADIVIFDPEYKGIMSNKNSLQGVDFCTYEGMEQTGRPETVILRGTIMVDDGKFICEKGNGKYVFAKPYGLCYE